MTRLARRASSRYRWRRSKAPSYQTIGTLLSLDRGSGKSEALESVDRSPTSHMALLESVEEPTAPACENVSLGPETFTKPCRETTKTIAGESTGAFDSEDGFDGGDLQVTQEVNRPPERWSQADRQSVGLYAMPTVDRLSINTTEDMWGGVPARPESQIQDVPLDDLQGQEEIALIPPPNHHDIHHLLGFPEEGTEELSSECPSVVDCERQYRVTSIRMQIAL